MPTTPSLALPYPALTDTPDVPYWLQQLAQQIETVVQPTRVWQAYAPAIAGTGWAIGNGVLTGRYARIGKTIHFSAKLVIGSTTTKGTGQLNLGLPSATLTVGGMQFGFPTMVHDISPNAWFPGQGIAVPGSSTAALFTAAGAAVNSTGPITFATGDEVFVGGTYEEA